MMRTGRGRAGRERRSLPGGARPLLGVACPTDASTRTRQIDRRDDPIAVGRAGACDRHLAPDRDARAVRRERERRGLRLLCLEARFRNAGSVARIEVTARVVVHFEVGIRRGGRGGRHVDFGLLEIEVPQHELTRHDRSSGARLEDGFLENVGVKSSAAEGRLTQSISDFADVLSSHTTSDISPSSPASKKK